MLSFTRSIVYSWGPHHHSPYKAFEAHWWCTSVLQDCIEVQSLASKSPKGLNFAIGARSSEVKTLIMLSLERNMAEESFRVSAIARKPLHEVSSKMHWKNWKVEVIEMSPILVTCTIVKVASLPRWAACKLAVESAVMLRLIASVQSFMCFTCMKALIYKSRSQVSSARNFSSPHKY